MRDGWRARVEGWESGLVAIVRSTLARRVGMVVGLGALAFLVGTLVSRGPAVSAAVRDLDVVHLVAGGLGLAVFHGGAIRSLCVLGGGVADARVWATAQLVKYLPVPGSAAVGMVGSAVHHGHSTREAIALMIRQTIMLAGVALLVSSPVLVAAFPRLHGVPALLAVGVGSLLLWLVGRTVARRHALQAAVASLLAWLAMAGGMGIAVLPLTEHAVMAGSAYAAGWVAGQVIVPVPAGLGVRESAMVLVLAPLTGTTEAATIALVTRVLHLASDGVLALIVLGPGGVRSILTDRSNV